MAEKARVLFILFEGLADTVIDSQVLSHVSVMHQNNVADFEVWAFAVGEENYQKSCAKIDTARQSSGAEVKVFRAHRPATIGSLKKNARLIEEALQQSDVQFTHIHARTEYSAAVASEVDTIRDYNLIWDCRGDAIAELDYRYKGASLKSVLIKAARKFVFTQRLKKAGAACDQALFVSSPLRDVMKSYIGKKPSQIVPCCASDSLFYVDEGLRQDKRDSLNLSPDHKLYTYVGSLAPYQRFEDTVDLFAQIAEREADAVLLVLTPDLAKAEVILEARVPGRYQLRHGKFDEINAYLNASDYAFMLRDPTPTNRVATPTKFAEYCLTGLPVIMSDAVEACYGMAKDVGNILNEEKIEAFAPFSSAKRREVAQAHKLLLSREGQVALYSQIYSL